MPLLGYEPFLSDETECAYHPAGGRRGAYLFFYPAQDAAAYSRASTGLQHLAFIVRGRDDVRRVHRRIEALRGEVLHPPQEFPQYPPPYFATFWLDPFGVMLEAVCHHDRD
jgi:catechol 2,3-dioxygenase-like lactoylglutathione lyase family enzyme